MRLASSARWGEPMVKRSGGADLSASRSLTAHSVMNNSLTGASVTSLAFFCHGINALPAVYPDTTPRCPFLHAMYLAQLQLADPLFAGQTQRRVAKQHRTLCGAQLQPPQGSESSVGLGVLLRRCASAASHIACPRTLLTSRGVCALRAWKDAVLVIASAPTHDQGRYEV